jgi:hypothetical protein
MVADELRRQADQFIDLADLETQICRDPGGRPQRDMRTPPPRGNHGMRESFHDDDLSEEV